MASQRSSSNASRSPPTDNRGKFSSLYALGFAVVLVTATVAAGLAMPSDLTAQSEPADDVQAVSEGVDSSIEASAKDTGPGAAAAGSPSAEAADKIPERVWRNLSDDSQAALSRNLGGYIEAVKRDLGQSGEITRLEPVEAKTEGGAVIQQHRTGEYSTSHSVKTNVTVEEEYEVEVTVNVTKTRTVEKRKLDYVKTKYATEDPGAGWSVSEEDAKEITVQCTKTASGWDPSYDACHTTTEETAQDWQEPDGDGWTQGQFLYTGYVGKTKSELAVESPGSKWTKVRDMGYDKLVNVKKTEVQHDSPGSDWNKGSSEGYTYKAVTTWEGDKYLTGLYDAQEARYELKQCKNDPNWRDCSLQFALGSDTERYIAGEKKTTTNKKVQTWEWYKWEFEQKDVYKWERTVLVQEDFYEWERSVDESVEETTVMADKWTMGVYKKVEVEEEYEVEETRNETRTRDVTKTRAKTVSTEVGAAPFTYEDSGNWTFASGVTDYRDSSLTVSGDALEYNESGAFALKAVDESGDVWWLKVWNKSTSGDIVVKTSTGLHQEYDASQVRFDFDAGTINGNDVGLTLGAGLDDPYELRFRNGGAAIGAYQFIVDGTADVGTTYDGAASKPDVAVAESILFSATFDVTMEDGDTVYSDRVTIEPDVQLDKPKSPAAEEDVYRPDADDDGVPNEEDDCPLEAGSGSDGCDDSDGDGVSNSQDDCPNTYGEHRSGCPDSDGDGIIDSYDQCPNTSGSGLTSGCPDSDGDGIRDSRDDCPNEHGTAANDGCKEEDDSDWGWNGGSDTGIW